MQYFSGFSLQNESDLFDFWLEKSDFSVAGFSYGAIKAVEYLLNSNKRVDRLLLLSPAYFNNQSEAFKKMQLLYYQKDPKKYRTNFLKNILSGEEMQLKQYLTDYPPIDSLKELLYYEWKIEKMHQLQKREITIEVVLGGKDNIIDVNAAKKFFEPFATVYFIKEGNHLLRSKK